jgi:EAL domain-containing protein (putative c-di-GMP-specific phosphodiesterase class I)
VERLLAGTELKIALQPIVDLNTGRLVAAEALARFPDDRPPDVWFAEAAEVGLGVDLELVAWRSALATLRWLPGHVELSVNASPALIVDARFSEMLDRAGVALSRLVVEITEHAAVQAYEGLQEVMRPLRERGIRLAVDDAGAGYASFSHVLRLRPTHIKLDRFLLLDLATDRARRAFVTAIVLLALELDACVTAEGVQSSGEAEVLASLGVDRGQGFGLQPPTAHARDWLSWADRRWLEAGGPGHRRFVQLPRVDSEVPG